MRTHGNEHWEFDKNGLMRIRDMSANDYPIIESERRYRNSIQMMRNKNIDIKSRVDKYNKDKMQFN